MKKPNRIALPRTFYERDTVVVAEDILGKYLVRLIDGQTLIGRIVEVEAYLGPLDLAAHSSRGITNRTKIMFGPAGFAYVYLIYGIHNCFNIVTEQIGSGTAILIRALEPIENIDLKTSGPGLLCRAMAITKALNGHDMTSDDFFVASPEFQDSARAIIKRPRIGVAYAKEWADKLLRFYIKDNSYISKK